MEMSKVGQTTYQANGYVWRDDEPVTVADGDYKTLPAAKLAARSWLARGATHFTIWRGTRVSDGLADEDLGYVELAIWDQDDRWIVNGVFGVDGGIDWIQESW
jgi:hypothetical protein